MLFQTIFPILITGFGYLLSANCFREIALLFFLAGISLLQGQKGLIAIANAKLIEFSLFFSFFFIPLYIFFLPLFIWVLSGIFLSLMISIIEIKETYTHRLFTQRETLYTLLFIRFLSLLNTFAAGYILISLDIILFFTTIQTFIRHWNLIRKESSNRSFQLKKNCSQIIQELEKKISQK